MNSNAEIDKNSFKLDGFLVEPTRNLFTSQDETYSLEPRIMDVLCVLAERPGDVRSRDELIERIWKVEFGADESLTRAVSVIRKTFRKAGGTKNYIETIPKRGYRLTQQVIRFNETPPEPVYLDRETPELEAPTTIERTESHSSETVSEPITISESETPVAISPKIRKRSPLIFIGIAALLLLSAIGFWPRGSDNQSQVVADRSLAVLPFDDYSPGKDQAYFADGIAEELLTVLSQLDGLRVASRTSSFTYRSKDAQTGEIGKALDVDHILEGSVRKSGGNVRVTAQLIDTRNDKHVWSQTYDRTLTAENIFAIQDNISRAIASELKIQMQLPTKQAGPPTESTEAYEAYLRAKSLYASRTKGGISASIKELQRAIDLDPNFAAAHATLARVYMMAQEFGQLSDSDAYALAGVHLDKALQLAPHSSESLTAKARVLFQQSQYPVALEYFNVATVANPLDADAWRGKGLSLRELGRMPEAMEALERAKQIEPLSSMIYMSISNLEMYNEDLDEAIENVETALQLDPENVAAREQLAALTLLAGDYAGAHRLYKNNEKKYPRITNHLQRLYYWIGRPDLEAVSMDWYNKAYLAFNAGDAEEAVNIALNQKTGPIPNAVEILYNAGRMEAAYKVLRANSEQLDMYLGSTPISAFSEESAVLYCHVLLAQKDPRAYLVYEKLEARFDGKSPDDFKLPSSLWSGASWQLLNNDPKSALKWLEAMNDTGQLWRHIEFDPLFDSMKEMPEFEVLWEQMEENAARYSDAIDQQFKNPEESWVLP